MRKSNQIILAAIFLMSSIAHAAVPRQLLVHQGEFIVANGDSKELDLTYIHGLIELARTELKISASDVIPMHMKATDDESKVSRDILAHFFSRFIDRTDLAIGKTLKAIEAPFQGDFSVSEKDGTVHEVKMNLDAGRALASISYSGLVNGSVKYQIADNRLNFELSQALGNSTKVVFNHTVTNNETTDIVGLVAQW